MCLYGVCFLDATDVNIVFSDEVRKGRGGFIKTVNIQACYFDKHQAYRNKILNNNKRTRDNYGSMNHGKEI